jgi:glycosyltransferase involved in cell wall biosynthesis
MCEPNSVRRPAAQPGYTPASCTRLRLINTAVADAPMNVIYLSLSYAPSRRASSVQVMHMCAAIARRNHDVTLVVKGCRAREEPANDVHGFYGLDPSFEVRRLPRPAWKGGGILYAAGMAALILWRRRRTDLVYSRDLLGAVIATAAGARVVYEAHGPPTGVIQSRLLQWLLRRRRFVQLVVISDALREHYSRRGLIPAGVPVVVAHDAAEPMDDLTSPTQSTSSRVQVGFVGGLYEGRGSGLLVELARRLHEVPFHVIGGSDSDLAQLQSKNLPPNLVLHGFVPHAELHEHYEYLDVLLMPYQRQIFGPVAQNDTSEYCSPMKMFEYMAAGKAIVSSDLPVLREVLRDGFTALLVPPDDAEAWEIVVRQLVDDQGLRRRLGNAARADFLAAHTWAARAERVLSPIEAGCSDATARSDRIGSSSFGLRRLGPRGRGPG